MIRVLLVEDDASIARVTERLIRRMCEAGTLVVTCSTAEAAIYELHHTTYDLVISDMNLAGAQTGADVLAFARSLPLPPKFLFLSSDERIQQLGVAYLEKPAGALELREAIHSTGVC